MKADKRCGTCEWWRDGKCCSNEMADDKIAADSVCRFWSASLDGAACEKCVYWGKLFKEGSDLRYCHKERESHLMEPSDWCGDFVPRCEK